MAGRGTDIKLGGNLEFRIEDELKDVAEGPRTRRGDRAVFTAEIEAERQKVLEAGGLFVLGTERHESRRIDNQLRGRSGRQGDPGLSRFYLSLDDDLLRIFGPQTAFARLMNKNLEDGEAIVSPVDLQGDRDRAEEGRGAQLRHPQAGRRVRRRDERPAQGDLRAARRDHGCRSCVATWSRISAPRRSRAWSWPAAPKGTYPEQWDVEGLKENVSEVLDLDPPFEDWLQEEEVEQEIIIERLQQLADEQDGGQDRHASSATRWVQVEKNLLIQTLDHHWKEHLATLDALRQVIHLRSYAQKKPIDEYKQEAFLLFERLLVAIREDVTRAADARPGPVRRSRCR